MMWEYCNLLWAGMLAVVAHVSSDDMNVIGPVLLWIYCC